VNALRLRLPLPPTQNHIWKLRRGGRGVYLTTEGQEVKQEIAVEAFKASDDEEWGTRPCLRACPWLRVSILYYLPDKRRRDLSNLNKLLLDGISDGIGVDDSRFLVLEIPPCFDKARPRCEVVITGLTEEQAEAQRRAFKEAFQG